MTNTPDPLVPPEVAAEQDEALEAAQPDADPEEPVGPQTTNPETE